MSFRRLKDWATAPAGLKDLLPVLLLILLSGLLAWVGTLNKSNTVDEVAHVLAGHAYWSLNDYRMVPESGNLSSRVAAIPLQFGEDRYPIDTSTQDWEISKQWEVAKRWWYDSGHDPIKILRLAHTSMLAFNLLGMGCLFFLASRLWGRGAGYFALVLAGFSPNFLGHMPLATSDFAGAWTLALATFCYGAMLEKTNARSILLAGLTAGIALITKQSNLLFGVIAGLLLCWRVMDSRPVPFGFLQHFRSTDSRFSKLGVLAIGSAVAALLALSVIWTAYGWRFSGANPEAGNFSSYQKPWITIHEGGALSKGFLNTALKTRFLPEAYIYGIDYILGRDERGGYLHGTYDPEGYRTYFLWSFIYKTPTPAIPLHMLGVIFLVAGLLRGNLLTLPILRGFLVLAVLYSLVLITTRLNIGYRHAFPLLYVSCIFAAYPFHLAIKQSRAKYVVLFLVALSGVVTIAATSREHYISYTNLIGGGAEKGYLKLTDSSIDWGQDVPAVARFIEEKRKENPDADIYLAAHGTSWLPLYGIDDVHYLPFWGFRFRNAFVPELRPGTYIFSATAFAYLYTDWTLENEQGYLQTRQLVEPLYRRLQETDNLNAIKAMSVLSESDITALEIFEALRCKRLVNFLSNRPPDRVLNGSQLVFELGKQELEEVTW
jgi:hypothetical protein